MVKPPPLPKDDTLRVGPRDIAYAPKYLSAEDLQGLKNLYFAARVIVEGAYTGNHKSSYRGSAAEFVDYREYNPGDDMRNIDWKAYARSDRHYIKLFEKETDMTCYLLVDRSASMGYGGAAYRGILPTPGVSKLEYAFQLTAALAYLLIKQGDRAGLTLFDRGITWHMPPGGTFGHLYGLLNALERYRAGRQTSVSNTLKVAQGLFTRRGTLVVISDLLDDATELFRALDIYRHRGFDVILFQVLHHHEITLPKLASVNFVDSETGHALSTSPGDIAASYERELRKHIDALQAGSLARNIEYNLVTTDMPHAAALRRYILRRGSRRS